MRGLAKTLLQQNVPMNLRCRLYSLDVDALKDGVLSRDEFAEHLEAVMDEAEEERATISINDIHLVLGTSRLSNRPDLLFDREEPRRIGTTTLGNTTCGEGFGIRRSFPSNLCTRGIIGQYDRYPGGIEREERGKGW